MKKLLISFCIVLLVLIMNLDANIALNSVEVLQIVQDTRNFLLPRKLYPINLSLKREDGVALNSVELMQFLQNTRMNAQYYELQQQNLLRIFNEALRELENLENRERLILNTQNDAQKIKIINEEKQLEQQKLFDTEQQMRHELAAMQANQVRLFQEVANIEKSNIALQQEKNGIKREQDRLRQQEEQEKRKLEQFIFEQTLLAESEHRSREDFEREELLRRRQINQWHKDIIKLKQEQIIQKHKNDNIGVQTAENEKRLQELHQETQAYQIIIDKYQESLKGVVLSGGQQPQMHVLSRKIAIPYTGKQFPTLTSWIEAVEKNPKNREGANYHKHSAFGGTAQERLAEFMIVFDAWKQMMASGSLAQNSLWQMSNTGKAQPEKAFYDVTNATPGFIPYAQKLIVQPGDQLYMRGDLHGDIFSLIEQLKEMRDIKHIINDQFRLQKDNIWIVFLGDYVDRGQYGCEVLYTMMRLALANPDRCIFVRGNHEDMEISMKYGFRAEVKAKFDDDVFANTWRKISRMNDFLPVVLYLGCTNHDGVTNYLQCCHGGIEMGYSPAKFLDNHITAYQMLGELNAARFFKDKNISDGHVTTGSLRLSDHVNLKFPVDDDKKLGFMWSDFRVDSNNYSTYREGRSLVCSQNLTRQVLEKLSSTKSQIKGILRAHQHGTGEESLMKGIIESNGVYKLWRPYEHAEHRILHDGMVWTFNVGADTVYGVPDSWGYVGFDFDTYAIITPQASYDQWTMDVYNQLLIFNKKGKQPKK